MADGGLRITAQPDGTVLVWLPYVDYLDTQAGPVEVGLDRELAVQLHEALSAHLCSSENENFQVVGDWGVDSARSAPVARNMVTGSLARWPKCGARAYWRIERSFDDDAEYIGPWLPLDEEGA